MFLAWQEKILIQISIRAVKLIQIGVGTLLHKMVVWLRDSNFDSYSRWIHMATDAQSVFHCMWYSICGLSQTAHSTTSQVSWLYSVQSVQWRTSLRWSRLLCWTRIITYLCTATRPEPRVETPVRAFSSIHFHLVGPTKCHRGCGCCGLGPTRAHP